MTIPNLKHAVEFIAKTPIEFWDGSNFFEMDVLGSFRSRANPKYVPTTVLSTMGGDPIALSPTNVIRDKCTQQIYLVIASVQNSHRGSVYQTTYSIINAPIQYQIIEKKDNAKADNGFSYGFNQLDKTEIILATTYTNITNRVAQDDFLTGSSKSRPTQVVPYTCYIDSKIGKPLRNNILRQGMTGNDYQFQSIDIEAPESFLCTLSIIGE